VAGQSGKDPCFYSAAECALAPSPAGYIYLRAPSAPRRSCGVPRRKHEVEDRAIPHVVRGPQSAAVSADNGAADREAEPHPLCLGREKGLEDLLHFFGRNPAAVVNYGYPYAFAIHELGPHKKYAFSAFDASYRVAAVHDEVKQHLLELHAVAIDGR
jgi:hypothetical protein